MKHFNRTIAIGLSLIFLIFLPLLAGLMYSLMKVVSVQNELVSKDTRELLLAKELRSQKSRQMSLMPVYILTGNPKLIHRIDADQQLFDVILTQLYKIAADPSAITMLKQITSAEREHMAAGRIGIVMKRKGAPIAAINTYFDHTTAAKADASLKALDNFVNYTTAAYTREKDNTIKLSHRIIKFLALASALTIILGLVITALLLRLLRQKAVHDETQALLTQKEKQLSAARKEVIEMVSHDLKSPLSAIMMSTRMMELKCTQDALPGLNKYLEVIHHSSQSMQRLITDLLDHTKIDAGNLVLNKKMCEIGPWLRGILLRFEPIATHKNIRIDIDIVQGEWQIMIDEGRLEQVISNLVSNALKFMPVAGTLHLSVVIQNNNAVIAVADTGPGMAREQTAHIFDRYWQARETAGQGTGLGLSISKSIVEAHQGKIWVESEPGIGSTFFVAIPQPVNNAKPSAVQPLIGAVA